MIRVVNWNVQWARPNTARGDVIRSRILAAEPDIVCLTEANVGFLPDDGFEILSDANYGYSAPPTRRKVVLWSRTPWREVDTLGDETLPGGRFISAITNSPLGPIRVIGVCIPWYGAHVTHGSADRVQWQDHHVYLNGLANVVRSVCRPAIVLGDFNQTIPRTRAPLVEFQLLQSSLNGKLVVATGGIISAVNKPTIDHVALTKDLNAEAVRSLDNQGANGKALSDHFGIVVEIQARTIEVTGGP